MGLILVMQVTNTADVHHGYALGFVIPLNLIELPKHLITSKMKYWLSVCVFVIFNLVAKAQDSTLMNKHLVWDLRQCISYAVAHNIQINSFRLSRQVSEQELLMAKASRLPNLSASATAGLTHTNQPNDKGPGSSGDYGLNSSATLYNGGAIKNTIRQKDASLQSAGLSIEQQENEITLQVIQAYLAILLDKETIIYDTDILNTSRAQVKLEQQRFQVGSVAKKDVVQLQAQSAFDEFALVSAQNTERGDLLTLKQLLILPSESSFDIAAFDPLKKANIAVPLETALADAPKQRPEIKNAQLGIQIADYGVKIASAGYKPALTAGASIGTRYKNGNPGYLVSALRNNQHHSIK